MSAVSKKITANVRPLAEVAELAALKLIDKIKAKQIIHPLNSYSSNRYFDKRNVSGSKVVPLKLTRLNSVKGY
jgi:hypothetical protein